ncbi:hypothetical protein [Amycolatopsis sp. NPDC059657]|uniref:hypothetical protein n=1 Tax=Amycolatopsis sp. NPDC059657 TaxID=3346899 RepID=UPI00366ABC2D
MARRFDPEQIAELAKKVGGLKDGISTTGKDLGNGDPGGAFGHLSNAANAGKTVQGFHKGVNAELAAAGKLVDAASAALADAARLIDNYEDEGAYTFRGAKRD